MKIVTTEQMRDLEEASASAGVSTDTLMENAGLAAAKVAAEALRTVAGSRVLVLVGPGNNGGDGLVMARHLQRWGASVTAYLMLPRPEPDTKLDLALERGVHLIHGHRHGHRHGHGGRGSRAPDLGALASALESSHMVVDAVLGTGRARRLEGVVRDTMLHLTSARAQRPGMIVLALDLPTGMNADTGETDAACPAVDITVTFGYPKTGHFRFPGASKLGRLRTVDIGIPDHAAPDISLELLTAEWVKSRLPPRPADAHKGTFGHTLVIAGSRSYVGAAYLASQGALRVGPGLVTLASPQGVYPILASKLTEVIHLPVPDDEAGRFHPEAAEVIKQNLHHYSSLLVGCGFGRSEGLVEFIRKLILEAPRLSLPVVIDADGLNNLSQIEGWWRDLKAPLAVTPHPGEMSTLMGVPTEDVQAGRTEVAIESSARWGAVVALKGAHTAIAAPGGTCRVSPFTNPGLSSGGTGDVLTGVIAGLMAQGLSPEDATCCGVYLHGAAGEMVRDELGDTGTLAGDLLPALPRAIRNIRQT